MTGTALGALDATGITYRIVRHEHVTSITEAAEQAGVEIKDIIKTIVVRRADDDYVFVLVPGDRSISWPKLRSILGVNRLSMPDAATAKDVTGYERGTITPFGSIMAWPVVADERIVGRTIHIGAGERSTAVIVDADEVVRVLDASTADVTDLEPAG
jgi:Cys-tRNA(Pro)/Cys-tRNA(Cys) deacylase